MICEVCWTGKQIRSTDENEFFEGETNMKKITTLVLALMMLMLAACGGASDETTVAETTAAEAGYKNDVAVSDIRDAVAAVYGENYLATMPLDATMFAEMYGVTEDMYEEFVAEIPMMSAHVDTLIVVKAKSDKVEAVKTALEAYRTNQVENGMHYPMNVPKVEASEVVVYGDYVVYIMLGVYDNMEADEATMLTEYQKLNQQGKDAIETILTK